ncbi:hypothetical protein CVU37_03065 [candidate division BRC1 bacterium HGW-BRC1-1]|nr:MAG: hypothetical protein CVU37_03065 [candidate division BRC1 bacterium HGW-BRC1-1]
MLISIFSRLSCSFPDVDSHIPSCIHLLFMLSYPVTIMTKTTAEDFTPMTSKLIFLTVALASVLTFPVFAQSIPRGKTTVPRSEYSVSSGASTKLPDSWNNPYSNVNGWRLSPFIVAPMVNRTPVVLGPSRQFSEVEYGALVTRMLDAQSSTPLTINNSNRTVVEEKVGPDGAKNYPTVSVNVLDILDRGGLLADTGEEIKLRGVRLPTQQDTNPVLAYYAREGVRTLRELTYSAPVVVNFQSPLRNRIGTLTAKVSLADGTDLGKQMLEQGFAWLDAEEAIDARRLDELKQAEDIARNAKTGVWSLR